jgi:hypothetical protein
MCYVVGGKLNNLGDTGCCLYHLGIAKKDRLLLKKE